MIEVPAGEFIMGTDVTLANDLSRRWSFLVHELKLEIYVTPNYFYEIPELTVSLLDFQIDRVKVTNARYRKCVAAGVCRTHDWGEHYSYGGTSLPGSIGIPSQYRIPPRYSQDVIYADYPALVEWEDANSYCQWVGKRLPTEAEWEKAARGTDGRLYPWGSEWDATREAQQVEPVGSRPDGASPFGVLDMIGNLPEWTLDTFRPYPGHSFELPATIYPDVNQVKTVRGGYAITYGRGLDALVSNRLAYNAEGIPASFRCIQAGPPADLSSVVVTYRPVVPLTPIPQAVNLSGMVYVPAGGFIMGVSEITTTQYPELQKNASPQHLVYLDAFYIDKHEVTNAEYVAFLNALGQNRLACDGRDCARVRRAEDSVLAAIITEHPGTPNIYSVIQEYERYPATQVSWYGAQAYCAWRGKRLPTEAEWEKAARGTDGRLYPWGNEWDARSLAGESSTVREIGSDPLDISPYGAVDMLGNAAEWASDWFDPNYYVVSPYRNPQGPNGPAPNTPFGPEKVTRSHRATEVTMPWGLSFRSLSTAAQTFGGFRCAYSADVPE
jgi:formylglycine-generating enzyme required for sulfatase activity